MPERIIVFRQIHDVIAVEAHRSVFFALGVGYLILLCCFRYVQTCQYTLERDVYHIDIMLVFFRNGGGQVIRPPVGHNDAAGDVLYDSLGVRHAVDIGKKSILLVFIDLAIGIGNHEDVVCTHRHGDRLSLIDDVTVATGSAEGDSAQLYRL